MIDANSIAWHRFYNISPESKTADQCASHGVDHATYGFSPQIDPRWNHEQKAAYVAAYENSRNSN